MEPIIIQINCLEYKNLDSPEKLIRYITRTRFNEDRANELLLWGTSSGYTYPIPVEKIIFEYEFIQKKYHTRGSLMCHYVIRLKPEHFQCMNNNICTLGDYAAECCNYLLSIGHQACFAIHQSSKDGLHIHLAINTTNYKSGRKLRQFHKEIKRNVEIPLVKLMDKYLYHTGYFSNILY